MRKSMMNFGALLRGRLLVPVIVCLALLIALCVAPQLSGLRYSLWKHGLMPASADVIERGLAHDPQALDLVVDKTRPELMLLIPTAHPTTGTFDLLVSKHLWPDSQNHTYCRLGERYLVFEFTDGRVSAIRRVSG